MTKQQVIDEIIQFSKMSFDRGLVPGTSGNISALWEDKIYVTATNTCLGCLKPEDIVACDLDGNLLEGDLRPSKETLMHAMIYKLNPKVKCVVHLHPTHVVALSLFGKTVPPLTATFKNKLGKVPMMPFAATNSPELFEGIEKIMREDPDASIFTIAEHGTVAYGETMLHAFFVTDLAEDTAKTAFLHKLMEG